MISDTLLLVECRLEVLVQFQKFAPKSFRVLPQMKSETIEIPNHGCWKTVCIQVENMCDAIGISLGSYQLENPR